MTLINFWIYSSSTALLIFVASVVCAPYGQSAYCPRQCIESFSESVGESTFGEGKSLMSMQWEDLLDMSKKVRDSDELKRRLDETCNAYNDLRSCLDDCQSSTSDTVARGFESLNVLCNQKRSTFLKYVPCLARYEEVVLQECQTQMNQSIHQTQLLNAAMKSTQQQMSHAANLKFHLSLVCSSTHDLVLCMERPTIESCGSREPVDLMRQLVALAFQNFERLYTTIVGFDDDFPMQCQMLIATGATDTSATYATQPIHSYSQPVQPLHNGNNENGAFDMQDSWLTEKHWLNTHSTDDGLGATNAHWNSQPLERPNQTGQKANAGKLNSAVEHSVILVSLLIIGGFGSL